MLSRALVANRRDEFTKFHQPRTMKMNPSKTNRKERLVPCPTRPALRNTAFALIAAFGFGLPTSQAAILVDLDATQLATGPLATWTNQGSTSGNFTSAGTAVPQVTTVDGVKGVAFLGGTTGAAGTH